MRSWVFLLLFFVNCVALAKVEKVLGGVPVAKNPNLPNFFPTTDLPEILISRNQYIISYNREKRSPHYALWKVQTQQLGKALRASSFTRDAELDKYLRSLDRRQRAVEPSDYTNSCFDRGHVVPSADRNDTPANNKQTFVMSNMLPQTAFLNRVVWAHLEKYIRDLVLQQKKKVYVIAGPIYDQNLGAIGPNQDIPVPSKEFKIVIILDEKQDIQSISKETPVIPVIIPNVDENGKAPVVNDKAEQVCPEFKGGPEDMNDWVQYKTTVEEIERLSGLKIFSPLQ